MSKLKTKKPLRWLLILILGLLILGALYATVINPMIAEIDAIGATACYETMAC